MEDVFFAADVSVKHGFQAKPMQTGEKRDVGCNKNTEKGLPNND